MITDVNIISSFYLNEDTFRSLLSQVGSNIGQSELAIHGKIFDGSSNLWIHLTDAVRNGYEGALLEQISEMLGASPKSFIQIEIDEGESAVLNLMKIVSVLAQLIPIVFDNCAGRLYKPSEIDELVRSGQL